MLNADMLELRGMFRARYSIASLIIFDLLQDDKSIYRSRGNSSWKPLGCEDLNLRDRGH